MTDRRDKGREGEDDQHRREEVEREQRAGELREAWRRRHPTEEERDKDSWPKKGSPARVHLSPKPGSAERWS